MAIIVKRAQGNVELCTDLNLFSDWEAAHESLTDVRSLVESDTRLGDTRLAEAAARVRAAEDAMRESTLVFRIAAVSRKTWNEVIEANPPREDNDDDAVLGFNSSVVFDEVLANHGAIISVTNKETGEPVEFDPKTEWKALADEMTDAQYNMFAQKVFDLNKRVNTTPFSRAASRQMDDSDEN